jgi:hypothetical protein
MNRLCRSPNQRHKAQRGFTTLVSVLILTAIGVVAAQTLLLLGLASSRSSLELEQSNQAKAFANACSEQALQLIRNSPAIPAPLNLTLGFGTCTATVSGNGQQRTINATGTVKTITRKVTVQVSRRVPIAISSWQEVAD